METREKQIWDVVNVKRRFFLYKNPQDIIDFMYPRMFRDEDFSSSKEKYLAFLYQVDKDNRINELDDILNELDDILKERRFVEREGNCVYDTRFDSIMQQINQQISIYAHEQYVKGLKDGAAVIIKKTCEWLKANIYDYFYWVEMEGESEANIKDTLFDDLKKAMEGEL